MAQGRERQLVGARIWWGLEGGLEGGASRAQGVKLRKTERRSTATLLAPSVHACVWSPYPDSGLGQETSFGQWGISKKRPEEA